MLLLVVATIPSHPARPAHGAGRVPQSERSPAAVHVRGRPADTKDLPISAEVETRVTGSKVTAVTLVGDKGKAVGASFARTVPAGCLHNRQNAIGRITRQS